MFAVLLLPEVAALMGAGLFYTSISNPEVTQDIIEAAAEAIGTTARTLNDALSNATSALTSAVSARAVSSTATTISSLSPVSNITSTATSKVATTASEAATKQVSKDTGKSRIKTALPYLGAAVFAGAAIYYMFSGPSDTSSSSHKEPVGVPASAPRARGRDPDSDDEDAKGENPAEENSPTQMDKDVLISKRLMQNLLKKNGEGMYNKMKQKLTADKMGKIWTDPGGDFRIDAGSTLENYPRLKTWHLQVNKNPTSPAAKKLLKKLGKRATHAKLLWGVWDLDDPGDYLTWVKEIMNLFQ